MLGPIERGVRKHWSRPAARALGLASLLAAGGCYWAFGVEHDRTVAGELQSGMSLDECLAVLGRGGTVAIEQDLSLEPHRERAAGIADHAAFAALERCERETGHTSTRVVVVRRHWGFAGLGYFYLFLSERGRLLGCHLEHIN